MPAKETRHTKLDLISLDCTAVPLRNQCHTVQIHRQRHLGLVECRHLVLPGGWNGVGVDAVVEDGQVTVLQVERQARERGQHFMMVALVVLLVGMEVLARIPNTN